MKDRRSLETRSLFVVSRDETRQPDSSASTGRAFPGQLLAIASLSLEISYSFAWRCLQQHKNSVTLWLAHRRREITQGQGDPRPEMAWRPHLSVGIILVLACWCASGASDTGNAHRLNNHDIGLQYTVTVNEASAFVQYAS